jgi:hypothetical protein
MLKYRVVDESCAKWDVRSGSYSYMFCPDEVDE